MPGSRSRRARFRPYATVERVSPDPLPTARQAYAQELRFTAPIHSAAVVKAFATVRREHFLGPGPWRILSRMSLAATDNADPRSVYHDVLVALDESAGSTMAAQPLVLSLRPARLDAGIASPACRRWYRLL